jgi:protoporphyrinogen oxidase
VRTVRIALSYARAFLFPVRDETNLEQFFVNRFGRELYLTFFKSYTEKVWGTPCHEISAEWGRQRIKGLSVLKAVSHVLKKAFGRRASGVEQKQVETSLIEQFIYPKFGPGQMWEEVARRVEELGGTIVHHQDVVKVRWEGSTVLSVTAVNRMTGESTEYRGDYFFSTMAVRIWCGVRPSAPAMSARSATASLPRLHHGGMPAEAGQSDGAHGRKLLSDN